jgi:chromosomal replication initiation ATPase DnaA
MPNPDKIEYCSDYTIADIVSMISKEMGVSVEEINGNSRQFRVKFVRQLCHAVAYAYSKVHRKRWTFTLIGKKIGNKDYNTVRHSRNNIMASIEMGYNINDIMDALSLFYLETSDLIYK